jgi:hypothetical protein
MYQGILFPMCVIDNNIPVCDHLLRSSSSDFLSVYFPFLAHDLRNSDRRSSHALLSPVLSATHHYKTWIDVVHQNHTIASRFDDRGPVVVQCAQQHIN